MGFCSKESSHGFALPIPLESNRREAVRLSPFAQECCKYCAIQERGRRIAEFRLSNSLHGCPSISASLMLHAVRRMAQEFLRDAQDLHSAVGLRSCENGICQGYGAEDWSHGSAHLLHTPQEFSSHDYGRTRDSPATTDGRRPGGDRRHRPRPVRRADRRHGGSAGHGGQDQSGRSTRSCWHRA